MARKEIASKVVLGGLPLLKELDAERGSYTAQR